MNNSNLISLADRSTEEQRAISAKGAEASRIARQKTGSMVQAAKLLTEMKVADSEQAKKLIANFGLDENATNAVIMTASVINKGIETGDPRHAEFIRNTIGETPVAKTVNLNLDNTRKSQEVINNLFGEED